MIDIQNISNPPSKLRTFVLFMEVLMKKLSNKFNTIVTLLLLATILCSSSSQAVSAEFDRNKIVDSNSWTKMASATKSTNYNYCAIYLRKMLDANKSEDNNYVNLNPKYDCYANGTWNIDRANAEY